MKKITQRDAEEAAWYIKQKGGKVRKGITAGKLIKEAEKYGFQMYDEPQRPVWLLVLLVLIAIALMILALY